MTSNEKLLSSLRGKVIVNAGYINNDESLIEIVCNDGFKITLSACLSYPDDGDMMIDIQGC